MITLLLGGARSGKSRTAEALAAASNRPVTLIATAHAADEEMQARIARHRAVRPPSWRTLEVPYLLGPLLASLLAEPITVVLDCLTVWVSNWILWEAAIWQGEGAVAPYEALSDAARAAEWAKARAQLLAALQLAAANESAQLIIVSNEVGLGIVPDDPLARRFRDEAGLLNQEVAALANRVLWCIAGLTLTLKDT